MTIAIALLAVGLGGWAAARQAKPPLQPVAAWLMLEPPHPTLGTEAESDRRERLDAWRKTQSVLIASPVVLANAASLLQKEHPLLVALKVDPVAWLQGGIHVDPVADTILTISMPDEPRADQAVIVNAVASAFIDAARDWEGARLNRRMEQADFAYRSYRQRLAERRQGLRQLQETNPEQAAAARDEIGILEEMTRRLGLVAEQVKVEAAREGTIRLLADARS